MKIYLTANGIHQQDIYVLIFKDTSEFIKQTYDNIISRLQPIQIPYNIGSIETRMILADYTEDDFLIPEKILQKYEIIRTEHGADEDKYLEQITNLCYKKDIIEHVFIYNGPHIMNDELKTFYIQNFNTLLKINNSIIFNNISNSNTLIKTSKSLYSLNMTYLQASFRVNIDCVSEYKFFYTKIINL